MSALQLSVSANDVAGTRALDAATQRAFEVPMPAPEDGCQAWEFQGLQGEVVALPVSALGPDFTVVVWTKCAPLARRDASAAILSDELGVGLLRLGVDRPRRLRSKPVLFVQ